MIEIELNGKCNYIHLLSGGLDSAYNFLKIAKNFKKEGAKVVIHPVFFDYGHYAANVEWEKVEEIVKFIRNFLNDKSIIDEPVKISLKSDLFQWCESDAFKGEGDKCPEIENRNMVLFSVLASYLIACAKHRDMKSTTFEISSGFKEGELGDCSTAFFGQINNLLGMYKKDLKFNFKTMENRKREAIIEEIKVLLGDNKDEQEKFIRLTTSCYKPTKNGEPCWTCSKCTHIRDEKMMSIENKINQRFSV